MRGRGVKEIVMRLLPALVLGLSACLITPAERPLNVRQIVENARALDGQEVVVTGWIEDCERLSCPLYASSEEVGKDSPYLLSIGPSRWFDDFARRNAPMRVNLRARVHARCITNPATGNIAVCADRSGTLEPLGLGR